MDDSSSSNHPMRTFDPANSQPRQIYKLMTGIIVPRPIALVSTVDAHGIANLAPFSFFTGVGSVPPTVLFCPTLRSVGGPEADQRKDTLRNVEDTGEFVVNVVSDAIAAGANAAAAEVAPEVDEFQLAHLTAIPSEMVLRAPAGGVPRAHGVQVNAGRLHQPFPRQRRRRAG